MSNSIGAASVDKRRRIWLTLTCATGATGMVFAAVPFVDSFEPSERARAAGAPVTVDIGGLKAGEKLTLAWRGKPVWILRRTAAQIAELPRHDAELADPKSQRRPDELTPKYARNETRSIKPEILVVVGLCTHLGCTPDDRLNPGPQPSLPADWPGGFLCPCHGSTFDLAGRVFKNKPAPDNLEVPPHHYLSDTRLLIGDDVASSA
jgi:ubiquinol-cytochrome c reductase iron-sulfur subunit